MATHESGGKAAARRNSARAAQMKADGTERTTARCGGCYAVVSRESWKSRYTHYCWSR
jgi:formamidopyrimidine-DNA glycosylase